MPQFQQLSQESVQLLVCPGIVQSIRECAVISVPWYEQIKSRECAVVFIIADFDLFLSLSIFVKKLCNDHDNDDNNENNDTLYCFREPSKAWKSCTCTLRGKGSS